MKKRIYIITALGLITTISCIAINFVSDIFDELELDFIDCDDF